jgi:hypothetical protein
VLGGSGGTCAKYHFEEFSPHSFLAGREKIVGGGVRMRPRPRKAKNPALTSNRFGIIDVNNPQSQQNDLWPNSAYYENGISITSTLTVPVSHPGANVRRWLAARACVGQF